MMINTAGQLPDSINWLGDCVFLYTKLVLEACLVELQGWMENPWPSTLTNRRLHTQRYTFKLHFHVQINKCAACEIKSYICPANGHLSKASLLFASKSVFSVSNTFLLSLRLQPVKYQRQLEHDNLFMLRCFYSFLTVSEPNSSFSVVPNFLPFGV